MTIDAPYRHTKLEIFRLGKKHIMLYDTDDMKLIEQLKPCVSKNGYAVDSKGKKYVHRVIMEAEKVSTSTT